MSKDDGGPALMGFELRDGVVRLTSQMTLRDYFAAAALQGILSGPYAVQEAIVKSGEDDGESPQSAFAQSAYVVADAMLNERAK